MVVVVMIVGDSNFVTTSEVLSGGNSRDLSVLITLVCIFKSLW
jgi:hypothetical protein